MGQEQCFGINASNNRRGMIFAGGVPLRHGGNELARFLRDELALELSADKTLITHAARFLGYEIIVQHSNSKLTDGRRSANGAVGRCRCTYTVAPVRRIQTVRTTPASSGTGGRSTLDSIAPSSQVRVGAGLVRTDGSPHW